MSKQLWHNGGLLFSLPQDNTAWFKSHAQVPIPLLVNDTTIRIYFTTRDNNNRSHPAFIETTLPFPSTIQSTVHGPLVGCGCAGSFDEHGVMASDIICNNKHTILYYEGWRRCSSVPFRTANGCAVSLDEGLHFKKYSTHALMGYTAYDPISVATQCVRKEGTRWRCWYQSITEWLHINNRWEPRYNIRYTESRDGFHWEKNSRVAIDFKSSDEGGIARPVVLLFDNTYHMWYSTRSTEHYHTGNGCYRIGYACSRDGIEWERQDDTLVLSPSKSGWDSEMQAYPYVFLWNKKAYMLYNGNEFGKYGFGYATLSLEHLKCMSE